MDTKVKTSAYQLKHAVLPLPAGLPPGDLQSLWGPAFDWQYRPANWKVQQTFLLIALSVGPAGGTSSAMTPLS